MIQLCALNEMDQEVIITGGKILMFGDISQRHRRDPPGKLTAGTARDSPNGMIGE